MYGWTDPNEPDGAPRRPQPSTDGEPSWLTDRPEPRSAYLFGDAPEQLADPAGPPTGGWPAEPVDRPYAEHDRTASLPPVAGSNPPPVAASNPPPVAASNPPPVAATYPPAAGWHPEQTARTSPYEPAGDRAAEAAGPVGRVAGADAQAAAESPDTGPAAEGQGRHRRRLPRPLVIGGAAAAATLVVSLGVGALVLPGDGGQANPASFADTVAAAPPVPEITPDVAGSPSPIASPSPAVSPTASPASASPKPTPAKTTKPTPSPARTIAASRQNGARNDNAPAAGDGTTNSLSAADNSQAQEVVDLVNAERAKAGCGKLAVNDKLMLAAQRHSQDQADHRTMSHTGSDGSNAGTRIDRVGYRWRTYGENVAWNQKTPAAVMTAWMNSSGHRANILNCAFTEIGVGVASSNGPYWTQVFAAPR